MGFDIQEYKKLYISTSRQLINDLSGRLEIYKTSHDREALADCHRFAHSLKSQSLVMGYSQIGLTARNLELLFKKALDGSTLTPLIIEDCRRIIITCKEAISLLEKNGSERDFAIEIALLQSHIASI